MRLTTRGRFAVTALLDLAMHQKTEEPVSLASISAREGISQSYLEQLFAKIRKHRLVISARGPGGGYLLRVPANEINIASIIDAVDDELDATQCGGYGNCKNNQTCNTHELWVKVNDVLADFLKRVTLADLIEQHNNNQRGEGVVEKFVVHKKPNLVMMPQQSLLQKELSSF